MTYHLPPPEWKETIEREKSLQSWIAATNNQESIKNKFKWTVAYTPLSNVANVEKKLPKNFIKNNGYEISKPCFQYISDLAYGEDYPKYSKGIPKYAQLKCEAVKRKLKVFKL